MAGVIDFQVFESRAAASLATAGLLAGRLQAALERAPGRASMVVSGGSTPGPCFGYLSEMAVDWPRVCVMPSDERWVAADDPASNEGLIRRQLLKGSAGRAQLLSFYREGLAAEDAPPVIEKGLEACPRPFSVALLGMGEDGHFASLFPDFEGLPEALDPGGAARVVTVRTAGSPHVRISLTLSALLGSVAIVLLMFGKAKRRVFEAAQRGDTEYPIEALLRHARCPVSVIWAP